MTQTVPVVPPPCPAGCYAWNEHIGGNFLVDGNGDPSAFFTGQHLAAARILPGSECLGAVLSRDPAKSLWYAHQRLVPGYQTRADMIAAHPSAQYAVISTHRHLPGILAFAMRPKAERKTVILSEKPVAPTLVQARAVQRICTELGVPLVSSNTWAAMWNAVVVRLLKKHGITGDVASFYITYLQDWVGINGSAGLRGNPEVVGYFGSHSDLGDHGFQTLLDATDQPIESVCCSSTLHGPAGTTERDAKTIVAFSTGSGVMGTSQVFGHSGNDEKSEIAFVNGITVRFSNFHSEELSISIPGYGNLNIQRGVGDYKHVLLQKDEHGAPKVGGLTLQDILDEAMTYMPHTTGHPNMFVGHQGRVLPPPRHPLGMLDSGLASIHFNTVRLANAWAANGFSVDPGAANFGLTDVRHATRKAEALAAAELSVKLGRPVGINEIDKHAGLLLGHELDESATAALAQIGSLG